METLEIIGQQHVSSPDKGAGREVMEVRDTYESLTFPPEAVVIGSTSSNGGSKVQTEDQENEENM